MTRRLFPVTVLLALALVGCGSPKKTTSSNGTPASGSSDCATVTGEAKAKPSVTLNAGCELPKDLITKDVIAGTGAEAKSGSGISVHYVGLGLKTKKEFDASWNRGEPFALVLGAGQVIPGWDRGLVGMKAGGRRLLVIPPDLAYGPEGRPPVIQGNETLVFVVDLVSVK